MAGTGFFDDLIPGSPQPRRTGMFDDLLPGSAPAAAAQPAEDARLTAGAATAEPGLLARIRDRIFASAPKPIVELPTPTETTALAETVKAALPQPSGPKTVTEHVRALERERDREEALLGGPRKPAVIDEPVRAHQVGPVTGPLTPFKESTIGERVAEVPGAFRDSAAKLAAGVDILTSGGNEERARRAAGAMKEIQRSELARRARTLVYGKDGSIDDSAIVEAAQAAPATLAAIPGAVVAGLPGAALTMAPAVAPDRFLKTKQLGGSDAEAMLATVADVAQEAATERVGLGLLRRISNLPAKVALARAEKDKRIVPLIAAEVGIQHGGEHASEQASNLMGWLIDKATGDPEATLGKLLEDAKKTAEVTAILSPVIGGTTLVGSAARRVLTPKPAAETHFEPAGAPPATEVATPPVQPAPAAPAQPAATGMFDDLVPEKPATTTPQAPAEPQGEPKASDDGVMRRWLKAAYGYEDPADIPADQRGEIEDAFKVWQASQQQKVEPAVEPWEESTEAETTVEPTTKGSTRKKGSGFLIAIRNAGGLHPSVAMDLMGDRAQHMNRRLPGLSKKTGMSEDALVEWLRENDYITQADIDEADKNKVGGSHELAREMVRDAMEGRRDVVQRSALGELLEREQREKEESDAYYEATRRGINPDGLSAAQLWKRIDDHDLAVAIKAEQLEETDAVDADLVAQAVAIDEAAVEAAATKYENDDAAFMEAVKRIINGNQAQQDGEAPGRGEENRGEPQGEAKPDLQLERQTEADLAARARAQAEAEAKRLADEKAAEEKRQADAQRGDFTLTGSERQADANPNQGDLLAGKGEAAQNFPAYEVREAKAGSQGGRSQTPSGQLDLFASAPVPGTKALEVHEIRVEPAKRGVLRSGFDVIDTPRKAAHVFAALRKAPRERFQVLVADKNGKPIAAMDLFAGSETQASVYPGIVAKAIYQTKGAAQVWFAHNHPSGAPRPSRADEMLTKTLNRTLGRDLGVEFKGHIIIAGQQAAAFKEGEYDTERFAIPAANRKHEIPIMERVVKRQGPAGAQMTTPDAFKSMLERLDPKESGLVLLDAQHQVRGWLPMTVEEMGRLRTGENSVGAQLFAKLARLNPVAAVAYVPEITDAARRAIKNVGTALDAIDVNPLDAFGKRPGENALISFAEQGHSLKGTETFAMPAGARGMPAGAATVPASAAGAPPAPKAAVDKGQARPDAIRSQMRFLFGAPLSEKHQGWRNLGIYRIKPETIRLRNINDIETAAHEIGHHISNRNKAFRSVMKQHAKELISIMPLAYKQAVAAGKKMSRKLQIEEGFAEFISEYLTKPATLQAKVPGFYQAFETWLGKTPEVASALQHVQDMIGAHQGLSAEDKILAKVGMFKRPLGERVREALSMETWDAFRQATLDKWQPLKSMVADLAPGLAASKNPYLSARLLAGDAAIIEDWIQDFTSPFDYAKRLDSKNYGQPLKSILEPIIKGGEAEINKFKAYLIARRAAELKKVGKENLLTDDEIAEGLKLQSGQPGTKLFEATANLVYTYNNRLLDYAVEGGLLSPETAKQFRQYANYIPFFRESDTDSRKGDGRGNPFKRLTGGTANLRDPFANLIQNTANIIHATNRNAMIAKAVELAKAVPGGGRWIETVPVPKEAHTLATQRIIDQLADQGVQIDTSMAQDMAAMQTFFTPSGKGDERTRTIVYKDGGELKAAQVNDPLLWKALGNIPPLEMGLIGKILAAPAQTLRAGVVLDPTFMVRNFVRDTLSATIQSKGPFMPVLSTAQGIKLMAQQKDAYKLWRSFGGAFADQFREPEEAAAVLQRMAKRGNFSPASIITPWRWLDMLKRVGSFTESGSRIGEFAATYKPGDIDSALQAALNSREVSTDFGMKGGSEAIQVLTRITPFMNPAMQGLYKTARVLTGADGKGAAAKAAILGSAMALTSIALALMHSDEDWYKQIEEWEKTTYWHFKIGNNVYRIPKPFEYGTLFASMPEAMALYMAGKEDGEEFKKRMLQALGQVFGFRVIPQVATILAEPWANKSIFTGRKLVPDRQEKLEPGLQAGPQTTKSAQVVGEAANVSPAMIDNVVRNVFGTIGVHALTVADVLLEKAGVVPPSKERGWQTWPAIKAFVRDPDNPNTKQQRDFYEQLEKYRKAVNTVRELKNRGEDDKAQAYSTDKAEELARAKQAESAAKRLASIRKKVRAIEWDREMSPAEKRERINEHNADMQDIAEEQTALYQAAKKSYSRPAEQGTK